MAFKTGKLFFDQTTHTIEAEKDETLLRHLSIPKATKIKIELLEFSGIDTPSDITIQVVFDTKRKYTIPLFRHRNKFLFQNNIFALDTSDMPQFDISLDYYLFTMKVISQKNFKLTAYYSIDPPQEQQEFDTL